MERNAVLQRVLAGMNQPGRSAAARDSRIALLWKVLIFHRNLSYTAGSFYWEPQMLKASARREFGRVS